MHFLEYLTLKVYENLFFKFKIDLSLRAFSFHWSKNYLFWVRLVFWRRYPKVIRCFWSGEVVLRSNLNRLTFRVCRNRVHFSSKHRTEIMWDVAKRHGLPPLAKANPHHLSWLFSVARTLLFIATKTLTIHTPFLMAVDRGPWKTGREFRIFPRKTDNSSGWDY